jgi:hypothetical protein
MATIYTNVRFAPKGRHSLDGLSCPL